MKTRLFVFIFIILTAFKSNAQDVVLKDNGNSWFTLLDRLTINSKWSVSNELHMRYGAFLSEKSTLLERPSIDYHLKDNIEISLGYSYLGNHVNPPNPTPKTDVKENNVWEQLLLKQKLGKVNLMHRFRQEHRWFDTVSQISGKYIKDGTKFGNRFRYRFTAITTLKTFENQKSIFIHAFDEIWLTQTNNLMPKGFARNWFYFGFGYSLSQSSNFQIGYMNQWDVLGPDNYVSTPLVQMTFVKNFTL